MEFFFTVVHEKNSAKKRKLDLRTGCSEDRGKQKQKKKDGKKHQVYGGFYRVHGGFYQVYGGFYRVYRGFYRVYGGFYRVYRGFYRVYGGFYSLRRLLLQV